MRTFLQTLDARSYLRTAVSLMTIQKTPPLHPNKKRLKEHKKACQKFDLLEIVLKDHGIEEEIQRGMLQMQGLVQSILLKFELSVV